MVMQNLMGAGASSEHLGEAIKAEIVSSVIDTLNREFQKDLRQAEKHTQVEDRTRALVLQSIRGKTSAYSPQDIDDLVADILRRVTGMGFLDLLLPPVRTDLSEITFYSSGLVQVMKKGAVRWETLDMTVPASEVFRVFSILIGAQSKALNEANPIVYAKLPPTRDNPGGGRITLVHPVIAGGTIPSVNLRLFELKPVHPEWIVEKGAMSPEMMEYLGEQVQNGARLLICGETRTGKTTLLSALCNLLPPYWRIVKIEDPAEIWVDRAMVQTFEARLVPPGSETVSVTLADLVTVAMRSSPDYLIVGEVRDGHAAQAMISALMSGTSGCCTLHARSPRHAFERLATLMGMHEHTSERDSYKAIVESVDIIVQIRIFHDIRRVSSIVQVERELKGGHPWYVPIFNYVESSSPDNPRWERVKEDIQQESE